MPNVRSRVGAAPVVNGKPWGDPQRRPVGVEGHGDRGVEIDIVDHEGVGPAAGEPGEVGLDVLQQSGSFHGTRLTRVTGRR